jgi:hypothetical protein
LPLFDQSCCQAGQAGAERVLRRLAQTEHHVVVFYFADLDYLVGDRVEHVSDSVVRAECTISVTLSRILTFCRSGRYSAGVNTNAPVESAELARRFRMIMGDLRWSRKRLSEATGISRPSLSNKLNGDVEFTYAELVAVIDALGVAWEELLANPFHGRPASFTSPPNLKDLPSRRDRRL